MTRRHLAKYRHAKVAQHTSAIITFASVALLDDAPQLWWRMCERKKKKEKTIKNKSKLKTESGKSSGRSRQLLSGHKVRCFIMWHLFDFCVGTYKSWAVVTEGGLHVSGLLEVVDKTQAQFGADDAGTHEIGCDLLSADKALPVQPQHRHEEHQFGRGRKEL